MDERVKFYPRDAMDIGSLQRIVNLARQRWTLSVINWTVVCRTKLTIRATIDGQFMTPSVQPCAYSIMRV